MFCTGCGNKMPDGAVKCGTCGKPAMNINGPVRPSPAPIPVSASAQSVPQARPAPPQQGRPAPPPPVGKRPFAAPPLPIPIEPAPDPVFSPVRQQHGLNVGRAFTYFKEDPDWLRKYGVILLCTLAPVLNFFSAGYYIQVVRNASKGLVIPLPEIDLNSQWIGGAMYVLAITLLCLMACPVFLALFFFTSIPVINVFAYILIVVFTLALSVYMTGAGTLAALEGNPWIMFRFAQCCLAIQNCVVEVVTVSIVLTILYLLGLLIIPLPLIVICGGHLVGQLGRIMRTHTRF